MSKASGKLFKIHFNLGDVLSRFLPHGLCAKGLPSCKLTVLKGFGEDRRHTLSYSPLWICLWKKTCTWNEMEKYDFYMSYWVQLFFLLHTTHRTKASRERQLSVTCIVAFVFTAVCKRHPYTPLWEKQDLIYALLTPSNVFEWLEELHFSSHTTCKLERKASPTTCSIHKLRPLGFEIVPFKICMLKKNEGGKKGGRRAFIHKLRSLYSNEFWDQANYHNLP